MQKRTKTIMITGLLAAALFGVASAGLVILNPDKAIEITKNFTDDITAKAGPSKNYSLPPAQSFPLASGPDVAFLKSFSKVFTNIAKETSPSLVLIVAEKKVAIRNQPNFPGDFFFPFLPPQFGGPNGFGGPGGPGGGRKRPQGIETDAGSGFIVDLKNGYVITNNHVIEGADKITITTYNNHKFKAKIVGTAKNVDIAVLKLVDFKPAADLKQVSLGDSSKVEVGDWAVALGAPFELPQTLTMGVVSAIQRPSDTLGIVSPNSFIQTDASINPGNSGGPLVNIDGQVIGMNTAIFSKNGTSVGIGFAIPSNTIRLAADSIISHGKFIQSYLGVEMYPLEKFGASALKDLNLNPNTQGGLVMRIVANSPAAKAGLKPYDIIQSVNGVETSSPADIQRQITFLKPGTQIKLGVLRNNKPIVLTASVAELPNNSQQAANSNDDEGADSQEANQSIAAQYGFSFSKQKPSHGKGIIISSVQPGSPAGQREAGLQPNDVILRANGHQISSVKDFEKVLTQLRKEAQAKNSPQILFLLISRNGAEAAVFLQLN